MSEKEGRLQMSPSRIRYVLRSLTHTASPRPRATGTHIIAVNWEVKYTPDEKSDAVCYFVGCYAMAQMSIAVGDDEMCQVVYLAEVT